MFKIYDCLSISTFIDIMIWHEERDRKKEKNI